MSTCWLLEAKSRDHQSRWDSSSGNYKCPTVVEVFYILVMPLKWLNTISDLLFELCFTLQMHFGSLTLFLIFLCSQVTSCISLDIQSGCCYAVGLWQVTHTWNTQSTFCISMHVRCEGVTEGCCFPLRCRCRSGLLHLWFPDSEHSARGARRYLCSHHGLSTSWPPCRSVSPPLSYHREGCHFTCLHLLCLLRNIRHREGFSDVFFDVQFQLRGGDIQ